MVYQSSTAHGVKQFLLQVWSRKTALSQEMPVAMFMGQHQIVLPSEQFGGGHPAMELFWKRRMYGCKLCCAA